MNKKMVTFASLLMSGTFAASGGTWTTSGGNIAEGPEIATDEMEKDLFLLDFITSETYKDYNRSYILKRNLKTNTKSARQLGYSSVSFKQLPVYNKLVTLLRKWEKNSPYIAGRIIRSLKNFRFRYTTQFSLVYENDAWIPSFFETTFPEMKVKRLAVFIPEIGVIWNYNSFILLSDEEMAGSLLRGVIATMPEFKNSTEQQKQQFVAEVILGQPDQKNELYNYIDITQQQIDREVQELTDSICKPAEQLSRWIRLNKNDVYISSYHQRLISRIEQKSCYPTAESRLPNNGKDFQLWSWRTNSELNEFMAKVHNTEVITLTENVISTLSNVAKKWSITEIANKVNEPVSVADVTFNLEESSFDIDGLIISEQALMDYLNGNKSAISKKYRGYVKEVVIYITQSLEEAENNGLISRD